MRFPARLDTVGWEPDNRTIEVFWEPATVKALQIEKPNRVKVIEQPIPQADQTEVVIQVMSSGICGTDIHILRGQYLGEYPVIPGHEFSGIAQSVGRDVSRFQIGDRVAVEPNIACDNCYSCLNNRQNFCLNWQAIGVTRPGGMAQYVAAPEKAVFSIGDLPFEHGAFVEPLSCVLHGVQRAQINLADRIAILGAGPIGILLLQTVLLQGAAQVTVVERVTARAQLAQEYGAHRTLNSLDGLQQDHYDVVIDATGVIPLMERTIGFARPGGTILLFGVPPSGQQMKLDAFEIFRKGLKILSSFTSVRNSYQAVALLQSGEIDVSRLISHRLTLSQFEKGVEMIEGGLDGVKKVIIQPQS
jgi:D-arabinitol dehydrogenase (NADP+)